MLKLSNLKYLIKKMLNKNVCSIFELSAYRSAQVGIK